MIELPRLIPDVEALLALEPEELGAKILFLLRQRAERKADFIEHRSNLENEPFGRHSDGRATYPRSSQNLFRIVR